MFIFFVRGNDTLKIKVKKSKYIVFSLDAKDVYCFALKKEKIYRFYSKEWKKVKVENGHDLEKTCDYLVDLLREKGWTTWQYQREMLSKLIYDLYEEKSLEWLFYPDKEIKRVELHHKNVLVYYQDSDIKNFCFSGEDLSQFGDYAIFKNKPKIHIRDGLRIPVKDIE